MTEVLPTCYDKSKYVRFPKMDHFSDVFGIPTEGFQHTGSTFFVSEKIDGANLGVYIPAEGLVSCFSRSGENAVGGLFKFAADKDALTPLIKAFQTMLRFKEYQGMYLWGEYFGQNVCRRIGYKGALGQFQFYDGFIVIDGERQIDLHPRNLIAMVEAMDKANPELNIPGWFVKYDAHRDVSFLQLRDACPIPVKSIYSEKDDSEGYVITEINDEDNTRAHRWKYKDPRFSDKAAKKRTPTPSNPELVQLKESFATYINENRVVDLLSKTTERTKLDVLVRALIKDAVEDFTKDNERALIALSDKERKFVLSAGSLPFLTLKEVLKKEKAGC